MENRDKVAMLLTTRGFSLTEGLNLYDQMMASEKKFLVAIDPAKDCVVWLEDGYSDAGEISLTIWINYRKDFCDNYALAGAVALDDSDLNLEEGDHEKFMAFFRAYQKADHTAPAPVLPDDLKFIFTLAVLTDYMECDTYCINDETGVDVRTTAKPCF